MLVRNIAGTVIIVLNSAGLFFVLVMAMIALKNRVINQKMKKKSVLPSNRKKKAKKVNIREDQDEIINQLNLSDFDDISFDDSD
ncbi:MAG: hypothetical protein R6V54_12420 [Desulfobacteraceae bacterium]